MYKQGGRKKKHTWLLLFVIGSALCSVSLVMPESSWLKYLLLVVGSGSLLVSLGLLGT